MPLRKVAPEFVVNKIGDSQQNITSATPLSNGMTAINFTNTSVANAVGDISVSLIGLDGKPVGNGIDIVGLPQTSQDMGHLAQLSNDGFAVFQIEADDAFDSQHASY